MLRTDGSFYHMTSPRHYLELQLHLNTLRTSVGQQLVPQTHHCTVTSLCHAACQLGWSLHENSVTLLFHSHYRKALWSKAVCPMRILSSSLSGTSTFPSRTCNSTSGVKVDEEKDKCSPSHINEGLQFKQPLLLAAKVLVEPWNNGNSSTCHTHQHYQTQHVCADTLNSKGFLLLSMLALFPSWGWKWRFGDMCEFTLKLLQILTPN